MKLKLLARLCILMACVMLATPIHAISVYGQAQATPENFPLFADDRVIRGENARDESYFEIGKGRAAAAGSYLDLYYGHSPTLLPKASSLTVLINDLPIGSVTLDESNKEQTLWRVDFSKLGLKSGIHKVTLQTHMEIANNVCVDPQNTANWTVILKNSRVNLNLIPSYDKADLTTYPSPFLEKGSTNPLQSIIAVPDNIDQNEFTSVAQLAQYFSSLASDKRIKFPVYSESELTDTLLRDNNVIWYGRSDHWKDRGQAAIEALRKLTGSPANQWQGVIGVAPSPWNAANTQLTVTGNAEELSNAATILTDETLFSQLQGNVSVIPAKVSKKEAPADWKIGNPYTVTLEKMGYNNITIEGAEQGNVRIYYPIPGNWDIDNGAGLKLLFKHSKSIDLKQSVVSVKLNGIPVESQRLSETTADSGLLELVLEPSIIGSSRTLEIDVVFQFIKAKNNSDDAQNQNVKNYCNSTSYLGNWAVIDKNSTLTYIPAQRQTPRLESLPYPFVVNGHWDQTALLLPDQAGTNELSMALTLAGMIGRNAQINNNQLVLIKTSTPGLKELLKDLNIIYLGTSKSLPDFMNGFSGSQVQFKDDQILSHESDVQLLSELQNNSAVIQITHSPLNPNNSLLIMSAASAEREASITTALTSPVESNKITGNFVIIDNQNKVHAFPVKEEPLPPKSQNPNTGIFFNNSGGSFNPYVFPITFLLIVVLTISLLWLNRKRR
ncbi:MULTISPECIES: cellulose biosynthesis cyclic di-GMP-binding regulatory protein BcsB [unclassified Paenibacillus]|uniref:cellulose biosynthesis cyclic di-GMP-binding regulatory protein BcsB n=1 Tax=unclassified Paenibacillus TaxID=185978 RepID=UPI003628EBD0